MFLGVALLHAQNFEDEFNAFAQQNEQSFNRFTDSINRQFAEAMEANMKTFTGEQPKVRDPKPKPVKLPEVRPQDTPEELPPHPAPVMKPIETPEELPQRPVPKEEPAQPVAPAPTPLEQPSAPPTSQLDMVGFDLFGDAFRYAKKPFPEKLGGITAKEVSNFWIRLSECDYEEMLRTCADARSERGFNDWAVYQLVSEMAAQTYPDRYDEQAVMTVFLLNQLGMEAKVGFADAHLLRLLAVRQQLYGVSFADIARSRYYLFDPNPRFAQRNGGLSFRTYDVPFPKPT